MNKIYSKIKSLSHVTMILCMSFSVIFLAGCKKSDSSSPETSSPNATAENTEEENAEDTYMKAPSIIIT